jgi:CheY-like chemotaxis protein
MSVHILVAGKSSANVELVKEAVGLHEYVVIPAPGMALALFLAQKNLPELIISDLDMTDGDGKMFLTEIKNDPELSLIPFLFLIDKQDINQPKTFSPKADAILSRPIQPQRLFAEINPYIQMRLRTKIERAPETPE